MFEAKKKIIVNIVSKHNIDWLRQMPEGNNIWEGVEFVFNKNDQLYDWLVVFDDVHENIKLKSGFKNTIHIATEPPTVFEYNAEFLKQFSYVIQLQKNTPHIGNIESPIGLNWHLGMRTNPVFSFQDIDNLSSLKKKKLISVISSNLEISQQHRDRLAFVKKLKEHYGDQIDVFGRGIQTIDDKSEALLDYRFHIVIENSAFDNYFSEKLTDCILAETYPIYFGCPNLEKYFPENSFLRIDIYNFEKSIEIIDLAIKKGFDQIYYEELMEAKKEVLYRYNMIPLMTNLIEQINKGEHGSGGNYKKFINNMILSCGNRHLNKKLFKWFSKFQFLFHVKRKIIKNKINSILK